MSAKADIIILGPAATVDPAERLRALLETMLAEAGITPGAPVDVADRDGHDLPRVALDLTGSAIDSLSALEVSDLDGRLPEGMRLTDRIDSMHATPGVLSEAHVAAHPARLLGVPVDLEAQLLGVPIEWLEDVDGRLGLTVDRQRSGAAVTGRARVSADQQEAIDALQPVIDMLIEREDLPVSIEVLHVRLTQEGRNRIRAEVLAKASKGILSAKATARALIELDEELVLRVRDLEVSSRNLVVAAALKAVESRLAVPPVDLRRYTKLGARLQDATLSVGERVVLEAVFG